MNEDDNPTDVTSEWRLNRRHGSDAGEPVWELAITLVAGLGQPPRSEVQEAVDSILDTVLGANPSVVLHMTEEEWTSSPEVGMHYTEVPYQGVQAVPMMPVGKALPDAWTAESLAASAERVTARTDIYNPNEGGYCLNCHFFGSEHINGFCPANESDESS